jgi:hypothetical protein
MALETFPDLAINLIYSVLCLVPGFITMKTAFYVTDGEFELDQFDKTTWSFIGSGVSLSVLYFIYVAWVGLSTGRLAMVVPIDLQWTELVAAYPLLLGVALLVGYFIGHLVVDTALPTSEPERSTD